MDPELDYEPEVDDLSTNILQEKSCEQIDDFDASSDHLYKELDLDTTDYNKGDESINENESSPLEAVKTSISPTSYKSLEEGFNQPQFSPDQSNLDEEFYIGSNSQVNSRSNKSGDIKKENLSDISSDEDVGKKRNRSRRNSGSYERDESRKRKTSSALVSGHDHAEQESKSSAKKTCTVSKSGGSYNQSSTEVKSSDRERISDSIKTEHDPLDVAAHSKSKYQLVTGPESVTEKENKDTTGPIDGTVSAEAERELWLQDLFKSARFFMIKSRNDYNVQLAKEKNVWSTTPNNEPRLNKAFLNTRNVILLFSVTESQRFAGFARLASESLTDVPMPQWQIPAGMSIRALSGVFKLDWITREELSFSKTTHLYNEWNLRKPVKIGRDGQEIEPTSGEKLCRLFDFSPDIDIYVIVKKVRAHEKAISSREESSNKERGDSNSSSSKPFSSPYQSRGGGRGGSYYDRYSGSGHYGGSDRGGRPRSPYRGGGSHTSSSNTRPYRGYHKSSDYYSRGGPPRQEYQGRRDYESGGNSRDGHRSGDDYNHRRQSPSNEGSSRDHHHRNSDSTTAADNNQMKSNSNQPPNVGGMNNNDIGDVSRETLLHGSYNDYMREFHKQMQLAYPGFPGPFPPPFMGMQFYPPPGFGMPSPFGAMPAAGLPSQPIASSSRIDDIDTHAKLVDKFLKNTRHRSTSRSSSSRSEYDDEENRDYSDGSRSYSDDDSNDEYKKRTVLSKRYRSRSGDRRSSSGGSSDDRRIQYSSRSAQRKY